MKFEFSEREDNWSSYFNKTVLQYALDVHINTIHDFYLFKKKFICGQKPKIISFSLVLVKTFMRGGDSFISNDTHLKRFLIIRKHGTKF